MRRRDGSSAGDFVDATEGEGIDRIGGEADGVLREVSGDGGASVGEVERARA